MTKVAVIGTGTMGSMAVWQLAKAGIDVVGYDQFAAPHDKGAHAGEGRFFRVAYHEGRGYVPLLLEARRDWLELEAETGEELFEPTGFVTIGASEDARLEQIFGSIEDFSLPHILSDARDIPRLYPQHHALADDDVAIFDKLAGVLAPERAVRAACLAGQAHGATIRSRTTVLAVEPASDGVAVTTESGTEMFDRAVVTAGPWAPRFELLSAAELQVRRLFHTWFLTARPEEYRFGRFAPFMRITAGLEDYSFGIAGTPSRDGRIIKAGATVPFYDDPIDPETVDRRVPEEYVSHLAEALACYLPGVGPNPIRSAVYMDAYTPDLTPIIDVVDERILCMAGFSGHGFKFAPLFGRVAAAFGTDADWKAVAGFDFRSLLRTAPASEHAHVNKDQAVA